MKDKYSVLDYGKDSFDKTILREEGVHSHYYPIISFLDHEQIDTIVLALNELERRRRGLRT